MKSTIARVTGFLLTLLASAAFAAPADPPEAAKADAAAARAPKKVYVLPIHGPIDKSMLFTFRRAFRQVKDERPDAIILDINTPGGRLKETDEIIDWMRSVKGETPVYAFVNPEAISAGAIISLGATAIFMSPGSSIGSAMPILIQPVGGTPQALPDDVKEKMLSYVRALVRGLAQENGYSADLAEAMVDPAKEFRIGDRVVSAKGQLLNLTGIEATEVIPPQTVPLLARAMVADVPALLEYLELPNAEILRFEEQVADRIARWITLIGPLLLGLGILGIYIEIKTPGFGLPGILGISLLTVYFFGHYVAGLAGMEEIALVMLGLILLAVEIFVIPGFGVVGFAGILCIVIGCIMGLIPYIPKVVPLPGVDSLNTWETWLGDALVRFLVTIAVVGVGTWLLSRFLPKTTFYRAIVLESELTREKGYVAGDPRNAAFMNRVGVAMTALRPAGTGVFGDDRLDVVTSGDMIAKGASIRVVLVEGSRIVVEEVPPGNPGTPA